MDIVLSAVALSVLGLPMILIALVVRLGSPGPALFCQRRAGWRGRAFTMLKFRTMRTEVDPYGVSPDSPADGRLTPTGRLLRQWSLDELPQLINILAGQMSIVGPRPLYERQAQQWDSRQRRRLDVRPGLTGYAQVSGRGELTIEDKIELDLHYVEHQSVWFDIKIIGRTVANIFTRRGQIYERQYSISRRREDDSPAQGQDSASK